jgi:hypothetical protein
MAKFMLILHSNCPFLDDHRIEIRQTDPTGCGGE